MWSGALYCNDNAYNSESFANCECLKFHCYPSQKARGLSNDATDVTNEMQLAIIVKLLLKQIIFDIFGTGHPRTYI